MEQFKVHLGKVLVSTGVDKVMLDKDPSIKCVLKDAGTFIVSDIVQDKLLDTQIDNLLGNGISQSQKDLLSGLLGDLISDSLINMRYPTKNTLIRYGLAETVDSLAFSDQFTNALEKSGFQRVGY